MNYHHHQQQHECMQQEKHPTLTSPHPPLFSHLPFELHSHIASFLSLQQLITLRSLNQTWLHIALTRLMRGISKLKITIESDCEIDEYEEYIFPCKIILHRFIAPYSNDSSSNMTTSPRLHDQPKLLNSTLEFRFLQPHEYLLEAVFYFFIRRIKAVIVDGDREDVDPQMGIVFPGRLEKDGLMDLAQYESVFKGCIGLHRRSCSNPSSSSSSPNTTTTNATATATTTTSTSTSTTATTTSTSNSVLADALFASSSCNCFQNSSSFEDPSSPEPIIASTPSSSHPNYYPKMNADFKTCESEPYSAKKILVDKITIPLSWFVMACLHYTPGLVDVETDDDDSEWSTEHEGDTEDSDDMDLDDFGGGSFEDDWESDDE